MVGLMLVVLRGVLWLPGGMFFCPAALLSQQRLLCLVAHVLVTSLVP